MNLRTLPQAASAALMLAACAAVTPTPVPDALRPGAGATLAMTASARGVQVYECRAGQWTFVAPEAELFDAAGCTIGTHGAGPTWQANDGSRVVASVTTRADAPVAGAIPWLLLTARRASESHDTHGLLVGITHIQRVNTAGGSAPAGACQTPGQPLRVAYAADYRFYRSQP
ncbi:DUF3455 domain-containing protein [Piscinibacter sp.]|uniref:DUF3455 domain-containing protein n=1 Tax=Piscinibacter sp. TaxID=1903157 RepID=UPI002C93F84D|nr:DUF3455 domain-containing protein [Albitalea sp.]HUG24463.1 DUF3455 domain-containing protein [Albitalea sp.]